MTEPKRVALTEEQRNLIQTCLRIAIDAFDADARASIDIASLNDQFNRQHTQAVDLIELLDAAGEIILAPDECA